MLTTKQTELLAFIVAYQREHEGVAPTYQEMAEAVSLSGKSGILRLLLGLEERGAIHRIPNRSRAIEVVKTEEAAPGVASALRHIRQAHSALSGVDGNLVFAAAKSLDEAAAVLRVHMRRPA